MKKPSIIILLFFLTLGSTAQAQFNKPLQSARSRVNSNEARYNIGIEGGLTSTYWVHFGGTKTHYRSPFNYGIVGGLIVERMINGNTSIALEGLYAMRNTQLHYEVLNFPVSLGMGPEHNKDFYRQFDADYQEVDIQVPLTRYLSNGTIRPFVYVAPRVSIPLSGTMVWQKKEILDVLPSRNKDDLCEYFLSIPREERLAVEYFSMDMFDPYRQVAKICFPNAKIKRNKNNTK